MRSCSQLSQQSRLVPLEEHWYNAYNAHLRFLLQRINTSLLSFVAKWLPPLTQRVFLGEDYEPHEPPRQHLSRPLTSTLAFPLLCRFNAEDHLQGQLHNPLPIFLGPAAGLQESATMTMPYLCPDSRDLAVERILHLQKAQAKHSYSEAGLARLRTPPYPSNRAAHLDVTLPRYSLPPASPLTSHTAAPVCRRALRCGTPVA